MYVVVPFPRAKVVLLLGTLLFYFLLMSLEEFARMAW